MKAELRSNIQIISGEWDDFILQSPQCMVYALTGYMDAAAPGWQAIECRLDGNLVAVMPLNIKQKGPWLYSLQPPFSQFWGVFFAPLPGYSAYREFSTKRRILTAMLDVLPEKLRWFVHGFAPEFDYPLPFHWREFQLQTRYTYRLDLTPEVSSMEADMGKDTRYDLKKSAEWALQIRRTDDPDALLQLIARNQQEGRALLPQGGEAVLRKICNFLLQEKRGGIWVAGEPGKEVAAVLTGTAAGKTAYLMSAVQPAHRNTGVMTVLLWHVITRARASGDVIFDFEGSMMEGIEGFFRGFSPRPVPYLQISKNTLPFLLRWIKK